VTELDAWPKGVEGHRYRTSAKLGTSDRRSFAAILGLD
jgi:hypothetical protein